MMSVISISKPAICWPPWKMPNSPPSLTALTLSGGPLAIPMIFALDACA